MDIARRYLFIARWCSVHGETSEFLTFSYLCPTPPNPSPAPYYQRAPVSRTGNQSKMPPPQKKRNKKHRKLRSRRTMWLGRVYIHSVLKFESRARYILSYFTQFPCTWMQLFGKLLHVQIEYEHIKTVILFDLSTYKIFFQPISHYILTCGEYSFLLFFTCFLKVHVHHVLLILNPI